MKRPVLLLQVLVPVPVVVLGCFQLFHCLDKAHAFGQTSVPTRAFLERQWVLRRKASKADEIEAMGGDPEEEDRMQDPLDSIDQDDEGNTSFQMLTEMTMSGSGIMSIMESLSSSTNLQRGTGTSTSTGRLPTEQREVGNKDDVVGILQGIGRNPSLLAQSLQARDDANFDIELDELLTLGGDPFFLADNGEEDQNLQQPNDDFELEDLLAMGGDPFFLAETYDDDEFHPSVPSSANQKTKEINMSQMETLAQILPFSIPENDGFNAMSILQNLGTRTVGFSNTTDLDSDQNLMEEIEAMGGDPFFLEVDESLQTPMNELHYTSSKSFVRSTSTLRFVTDGQGPTPKSERDESTGDEDWEWDGQVDDDAHLDVM